MTTSACVCVYVYVLGCVFFFDYLFKQEGGGGEGEGPAVVVVEELLWLSGSVHHLIINTGDIQDQANHQTETCKVK